MVLAPFRITFVIALCYVGTVAMADALYFPGEDVDWARVSPAEAGWDAAALDVAIEFAGAHHSSGVVVLQNGRILAERIWPVTGSAQYARRNNATAANGHAIEDVASVQKSVVAFLIGVAERKKLVSLAAPVSQYLGAGWSKADADQESVIAIRHLLSMSSGLTDALEFESAAGGKWRYNTRAYSKLIPVLEKATASDINTITRDWLTGPIGMNDSRWVARRGGGPDVANPLAFQTTVRDLARFGLLILAKGSWNDTDLLQNPDYFKAMVSPSQDMNKAYGYLWWLNGYTGVGASPLEAERTTVMIPSAPADLVAAQGVLGRKCYVVPSLHLVVTRLGDDPGEGFNEKFWTLLMKAAPADDI